MTHFRQTVVIDYPPCFERCVKVFGREHVDRKGIIFSWGKTLYNPSNASISRPLIEHEAVHGLRQLGEHAAFIEPDLEYLIVSEWWERYLTDRLFRLDEELYAYHAQYIAHRRRHGQQPRYLNDMAALLAGPMYGNLLSIAQAKHAILTGVVCLDPMKERSAA